MNKMGKRTYITVIADALIEVYGNTLTECDTDIKMAENVLKHLNEFLFFRRGDMSDVDFEHWKQNRTLEKIIEEEGEEDEY